MCVCNREFEKNASRLLDKLYAADSIKSHVLLRRPLETWNKRTVFELAANAGLVDFMKHDCCQTKLDQIWHGQLARSTATWKVGMNYYSLLRCNSLNCTVMKISWSAAFVAGRNSACWLVLCVCLFVCVCVFVPYVINIMS